MRIAGCILAAVAALATWGGLSPVAARAEVSVDRDASGGITAHFVAGERGPWELLRADLAPGDVLNEQGDTVGDGWPVVFDNVPLARPEAVWSSSGEDADVFASHHDGTAWTERRRLSSESGSDTLPSVAVDQHGNRFIAWDRHRNGRHSVEFTGLSAGDSEQQSPVEELSSRPRQGRAPSVAAAEDGLVWVAYEEAVSANDPTLAIAIDRVDPPRESNGILRCGGEVPIDIARSATLVTHRAGEDASADARMHAEGGEVWATWIDSDHEVGYSQLVDGEFGAIQYRSYAETSEIPGIRADIRDDILGP